MERSLQNISDSPDKGLGSEAAQEEVFCGLLFLPDGRVLIPNPSIYNQLIGNSTILNLFETKTQSKNISALQQQHKNETI